MKCIQEVLDNKQKNYLFPFFWQHGESKEVLSEYLQQMLAQGIQNICIESRPHPDFLGDGWWETMDFLISEAKQHDMKIWILDDAKFPTGYANGKVPDDLKKRYLALRRFDVVGPNPYAQINLATFVDMRTFAKDKNHLHDRFFKAFLVERREEQVFFDTIQEISDGYQDGMLNLTLENKHYVVYVLFETRCGEETTKDYLDPMRKEATQILIDEVYEKHYQHYASEFGKTILGFFSDEPRFGNMKGTTASIGREKMPLPWNETALRLLQEQISNEELVYLFEGDSSRAHEVRFAYMDIVTKLYSENFSGYIGKWCEDKGVIYVGHTIEDNNAHARLGYGTGHYFRGIAGQHMAGIDIIGGQVVPGMDYQHDAFSTGGSDGEFYHYALVKLGASAAKLDSKKQGRLMCEAFGAYGWSEGLKMMTWITNHMISQGVNTIVPHAFDPKDFPDWDCPPHFYAHGMNPQYPYFHYWANYANRLCHLFSDGYHQAEVGVLYHAFAEWSGDYMLIQKVLKQLSQSQISHDIISEDYLMQADVLTDGYQINGYTYKVLVIPYAKRLPTALLEKIKVLAKHTKVIFVEAYPDNLSETNQLMVCPLSQLATNLKSYQDFSLSHFQPYLTSYHYIKQDGDIYMLNNEDVCHEIDCEMKLTDGEWMIYDAYENETYELERTQKADGYYYHLHLAPYQAIVLVKGKGHKTFVNKGNLLTKIHDVTISMKANDEKAFTKIEINDIDTYLGQLYPRFSGSIKYEFDIDLKSPNVLLNLAEAYEIVTVSVNGSSVGIKIAPPYQFDLSKHAKKGNNHLEMIVVNTLVRQQRDMMSSYLPMEPLGITSPVEIYQKLS